MEKNIINSLKRLERVGSETSVVTKKLKCACENIGALLEEKLMIFKMPSDEYDLQYVVDDLYIFGDRLLYDYDDNLNPYNSNRYCINPREGYITRQCALAFASAVANGLLNNVASWITKKNIDTEIALEKLTIN